MYIYFSFIVHSLPLIFLTNFHPLAIGGLLATPVEGFPSVFPSDGLFGRFPFLLPNLFCAGLLLLSMLGGAIFLVETHPGFRRSASGLEGYLSTVETPLIVNAGAAAVPGVDLQAEPYGTFNTVDMHADESWQLYGERSKENSLSLNQDRMFTWRVTMLVLALGIFTYHSMTFDHLLPIFLQDENHRDVLVRSHLFLRIPGGLGLTTRTVGLIMSVNGVIALFIQGVVFPPLADRLGIWKLFVMVTALHPVTYFIVPFLVFLPSSWLFSGIYVCLIIRNSLSIIAYPVLLILIKQASPSTAVLGKINGLAASAGAACRTVAPPVAGYLYGVGTGIGCTALAWWASSLIALIGSFQLGLINCQSTRSIIVQSPTPGLVNAAQTSIECGRETFFPDSNGYP